MTRRNFLKHSIGGGALLSLATPAVAQSATTLRLISTDAISANAFASRISAVTQDALKIETTILPMAEAAGMLDRVSAGDADMCLTTLDHFLAKSLAFGLFACMPFGMSTGELEGWLHASDGNDMLDILSADLDMSFRFAGDLGIRPMWSKQPLSDLATLQGQTVGSTGLSALNLRQAGVKNVVDLATQSSDLEGFDVIDGMSVVEIEQRGLMAAFPHMTSCNPNSPSGVLSLAIANNAFDQLDDAQRILIERASSANLTVGRARSFHENATAIAAGGSALSSASMPEDIWQGLSQSAQAVLETIFNEGDVPASVVDAYVYFMTDISGWSEIGEAAYYAGRQRLVSL